MIRAAVLPAALTGVFCAGFSVFVSTFAPMLGFGTVVGVSFVSGFLGSLFATFVMGKKR